MDTLLGLLKQNARFSTAQLASLLGISEQEVISQMETYEKEGIIRGYSVILDEEKASKDSVTAVIELKVTPRPDSGFDEIAQAVMRYDEVESVSLMSGSYDLSVTISGDTMKDIALFVAQRLSSIEGVLSTATHFVLKRYKEHGIYIDGEKEDERSELACP